MIMLDPSKRLALSVARDMIHGFHRAKSHQVEIAQLSGIELVIASLKRFPTEPGVQENLGSGPAF